MRILVTGALGHIGSDLIRKLPRRFEELELILIDNLLTQRYASLFSLPPEGRFRFVEADVTEAELDPLMENVDVVVHLAALTDAESSVRNPKEVARNNLTATKRVAAACTRSGSSLVAISTTSVYGPQSSIVSEDCTPEELAPQSPYAEVKLQEEAHLTRSFRGAGLKGTICRFGTIFGPSPGMRFHTAVNKFIWQAVMGQPITVWSTAYEQKRPYLDLEDATNALVFLIDEQLFGGDTYNVVTTNATVGEIVDTIGSFIPDLTVQRTDSPLMNQLSYEVSTEKIMRLGFDYSGDLRDGIGRTISILQGANTLENTKEPR